jgi:hypothetical protein
VCYLSQHAMPIRGRLGRPQQSNMNLKEREAPLLQRLSPLSLSEEGSIYAMYSAGESKAFQFLVGLWKKGKGT